MATKVGKAEAALAEARAEAEGNLTSIAVEAAIDAATQIAGVKATKAEAGKAVKAVAKTIVAQEAV
jgi:hypothetical protein